MGKTVAISLKSLYDYYTEGDTEYYSSVKTAFGYQLIRNNYDHLDHFDEKSDYFDLYDGRIDQTLCCDGEEVEVISEGNNKVTLKNNNLEKNQDGIFYLSKKEFDICTFN